MHKSSCFILSSDICGFNINFLFTKIQINYLFSNYYFLKWDLSLNISYTLLKLYRSLENILVEGIVLQNCYSGLSFHFMGVGVGVASLSLRILGASNGYRK